MLFVDGGNDVLVIGQNAPDTTISGSKPAFQVIGSGFDGMAAITRRDSGVYGPALILSKSKSTTPDNYSIVANGDTLGGITFIGDDGTNLDTYGATIQAVVDGTPGENDMPTRLVFSTTADGAASPTERMRIDSSGNVGIAMTPDSAVKLSVSGAIGPTNGSESAPTHTFYSDADTGMFRAAANTLAFATGGSERIRVFATGSVAIGSDTPGIGNDSGTELTVSHGTEASITIRSGTSNHGNIYFSDATSGTAEYVGFIRYNHGSNYMMFQTNGSERMRISSAGDVSIGTSVSPPVGLTITADEDNHGVNLTRLADSGNPSNGEELGSYAWNSNAEASNSLASAEAKITAVTTQAHSGTVAGTIMKFYCKPDDVGPGSAPYNVMNMNGYALMIKATANTTNVFGASKFFINAENQNNGMIIDNARENYTGYGFQANDNTGTRYPMYIVNGDGTNVGSISMTSTATAFNTSSDYRLKENVNYDWDATSTIKQLKPCKFNFKTDTDNTITGFLAHEAQSVVSNCVIGEKDKVNDKGNAEYQSIDHSKLVPLLVKTIQELEARIAKLEGG
jgi:hypothetical protein